jgi:RimJ/RimL family protein N-acetyltransferase
VRDIGRIKHAWREDRFAGIGMLLASRALYPHLYAERSYFLRVVPPQEDPGGDRVWITDPSQLRGEHDRPEQVIERFERGARCAAFINDDGTCMAQYWVSCGEAYDEIDLNIELPENAVWFFDGWTHPRYRGRGYARALVLGMLYELSQQGIAAGYARVDTTNKSSLASLKRTGAKVVGKVTFVRLGKLLWQRGGITGGRGG